MANTNENDGFLVRLRDLPGCYVFSPEGRMQILEDPTPELVAQAIFPGCEDLSMIDSVTLPAGREMRFNSFAERDEAPNPLATYFYGHPVYGTAVVMPA